MKDLRYKGRFATTTGNIVRVELWQETDTPYRAAGQLEFPYDEPLTIEWEASDKMEPVERSHATLRLISPGDRTYCDLWSDTAATVRMDVYIDDALYWSGTMDPEQYEEPYERAELYEVELSFGDLGVLDRKKYIDYGVKTVREIVDKALAESEIRSEGVSWAMCSTYKGGEHAPGLPGESVADGFAVSSERWTDSDGEQATMLEVLEETLRPLGLKIRQRAGRMHVYDMNGLATYADQAEEVYWTSDSQTLGADVIYNRVKVTWETYARSGNMVEEDPWGDETPDADITTHFGHAGATEGDSQYWTYQADIADTNEGAGFTLWTKSTGRGLHLGGLTQGEERVFCEVPHLEGEAMQGVAVAWPTVSVTYPGSGGGNEAPSYEIHRHGIDVRTLNGGGPTAGVSSPIFGTDPIDLTAAAQLSDLMLTVKMPLLLSTLPVPHSTVEDFITDSDHAKDIVKVWKLSTNIVYVPITLIYHDYDTDRWYAWRNKDIIIDPTPNRHNRKTGAETAGTWTEISEAAGMTGRIAPQAWLTYYDQSLYDGKIPEDEEEESAFADGRFVTNRPALHKGALAMRKPLEAIGEGQPIAYPPGQNGALALYIPRTGWMSRRRALNYNVNEPSADFHGAFGTTDDSNVDTIYSIKWVLCGMPEVSVSKSFKHYDHEIDDSNVEYETEINPDAAEELDITTLCGTADADTMMSRGAYIDKYNGCVPVRTIRRGPNDAAAGDILCNTALSQYRDRKTTLSGESRLTLGGVTPWTEAMQPGKVFYMASEYQDVRAMTNEVNLIETNIDEPITE